MKIRADFDHILDHTRGLWDEIRGERLFITGGTGFVGTWLVDSLLWANQRLDANVSAVLLTRDPERLLALAPHLAHNPAITLLRGDAQSFTYPEGRFSLTIHAATEPIFDANVEATRRVLGFARTHGTRSLLFTSSGAVYGLQPPDLPNIPEDYPGSPSPVDPDAAYGHSKRVSEFLCASHARVYGFEVKIARLFAFTGAHLPLDGGFAAGNFLRDLLGGGPIRISGDGTPYRSYLYAADLAIWLWTILLRGKGSYPYNVGSAEGVTILELARRMRDAVAPDAAIEVAKQAVEGQAAARYVPSTTRAESELGLRSRIPLEEGIRRMARWHLRR